MFIVTEKSENHSIGQRRAVPLIDFHTHIGKVKIETTKGVSHRINRPQNVLDMYQKLGFALYSKIIEKPDSYYVSLPPIDEFVSPRYPIVKNTFLKSYSNTQGWLADHIVTFPFNDIFHLETHPKFVKSNDYIRQQVRKPEFTFRFTPFCRVDATEKEAPQEIQQSWRLGSQGLKLHPLSQHWIEKIVSEEVKNVLTTAAKFDFPIIFDVPNKGVAKDITQVAQEARQNSSEKIKVILGHNGFDYSSTEIFEYISQNDMYTEISGMRGSDVALFFKNIINVPRWDEKILFGSDANYFSVLQAVDFISYLFTYEFLDVVREDSQLDKKPIEIVANILGLNALKILPHKRRIASNALSSKVYSLTSTEIKDSIINFLKDKTNRMSISLKQTTGNGLCYFFQIWHQDQLLSYKLVMDHNGSILYLKPITDEVLTSPGYNEWNSDVNVSIEQSIKESKNISNFNELFVTNDE